MEQLGSVHTRVFHCVTVNSSMLDEKSKVPICLILEKMDLVCVMSCEKHALRSCVTVSMDDVNFHEEVNISVGDVLIFKAQLNRVFTTSMEVGCRVEVEKTSSTMEKFHLCSSYFTFVALDEGGKKTQVPEMIPVSDKEKIRFALAGDRRMIRKQHGKIVGDIVSRMGGKQSNDGNNAGGSTTLNLLSLVGEKDRERIKSTRSSFVTFLEDGEEKRDIEQVNALVEVEEDFANVFTQLILPQHSNHHSSTLGNFSTVFGGQILSWSAEKALICAMRHCGVAFNVYILSVDDVYFLTPASVGTRVVLKCAVNRTFNKSLEVGVRVEGHTIDGMICLINRAYFTLIAIPKSQTEPKVTESETPPAAKKKGLFSSNSNVAKKKKQEEELAKEKKNAAEDANHLLKIPPVVILNKDMQRRYDKALGRRGVRLERLQLKREKNIAWEVKNENVYGLMVIENLKGLERVIFPKDGEKDPWVVNKKESGVTVFFRESMQVGLSIKTECEVNAPLEAVIRAVKDYRMDWDKYVKEYEVKKPLKEFKSDLVLMCVEVPGRKKMDFSLLRSIRRTADAFFVASHSIVHECIPQREGFIRGETGFSGFVLQRGGNKKKTNVVYVAQLGPTASSLVSSDLIGQTTLSIERMKDLQTFLAKDGKEEKPNMEKEVESENCTLM